MSEQLDVTQVQRISENTGLEITTVEPIVKDLLTGLTEAFEISKDFEEKVMAIKVTDPSQIEEIDLAAEYQKQLGKMRIFVEKSRKRNKAEYLEKGRNIDKIASWLQERINPLEDYAKSQSMYFELQAAQVAKDAREKAEKVAEVKRIADEEAERVEQERIRQDNIRLQKEAVEQAELIRVEREKANAERIRLADEAEAREEAIRVKAQKERELAEKTRLAEQKKHDDEHKELLRIENEKAEKLRKENEKKQALIDAKAEKEREIAAEKEHRAQEMFAKQRRERERLQAKLDAMVECPQCGHKFTAKE